MAIAATLYRFDIQLSDVDRGVYEELELRVAQHPSETSRYLLTRVLAFCLSYEEGIEFSRGLASSEEPAVWVKDLRGTLQAWIEVGAPSAERLHKAMKAVGRVTIFTHHDLELLRRGVRGKTVHQGEAVDVYVVEPNLLEALEATLGRSNRWTLARTDGEIFLTVGDLTLTTSLERVGLFERSS
jgi:uncharacterized protein YaeQ